MNEANKKRRTSILKKRPSTEDDPTEITVSKFPKRNQIQFSQKKQVKEFTQCEENLTIWGNTYETSVGRSEGSSDGSSTSRKISVDFSHTTINVTNHEAASMNESGKENLMVQKSPPRRSDEVRSSLNNLSSASNSGCSIEITTVDMNADERKRINKYGTDNLNITNMPLDNSYVKNKHLNVPGKNTDKILSPRKMIYLHKSSNLSVIIKDKVLMSPSEMDDNVSVSIEDDEKHENIKATSAYRKTITKPVEMNISIENKTSEVKKSVNSKEEKPIIKPPAVEKSQSMPKIVPTVFKFPEVPKTFNFQPQSYDSPPIKPAALNNQKEEIDELFEMMISDTPSKNLCCIGKTHTPMKSAQKVLFSASRPTALRNSTDIFREIGLIDDDEGVKLKTVRKTIFHDDSIKLDAAYKDVNRKTTFDKIKMDETIDAKNKTQNDGDLDISVEPETKIDPILPKCEVFTDKMEETYTEKLNEKSAAQKSFFDLDDDDASCSVAKNIQLMKLKSIDYGSVEKSLKRSTLSNDTCNATKFIMELTNIDDTGGSLETTAEIQRKATKLLKNPHATLGSSSTINSPFPEDFSETITKEVSKVHKSLNLEQDKTLENLQKSSTSYKNRMTTFDENKMEISGIVPTLEDSTVYATNFSMQRNPNMQTSQKNVSKIHEESAKSRVTSYNIDQMDMSRAEITVDIREQMNALKAYEESTKGPVTSYNIDQMDMSRAEITVDIREQMNALKAYEESTKSRVTSYNIDQMDMSRAETTLVMPEHTSMANLRISKQYEIHVSPKEMAKAKRADLGDANKSNYLEESKKRVTTYNADNMDLSGCTLTANALQQNTIRDSVIKSVKSTSKIQIYTDENESMQEETQNKPSTTYNKNDTNKAVGTTEKNRTTSYNLNNMDISGVEATAELAERFSCGNLNSPVQEDLTDFIPRDFRLHKSMLLESTKLKFDSTNINETHKNVQKIHDDSVDKHAPKKAGNRATSYDIDTMDITNFENISQVPLKQPVNSRTTVYNADQMDLTITSQKQANKPVNNRATTYNTPTMEFTNIGTTSKIPLNNPVSSRATIYDCDQMDVTNVTTTQQLQANKPVNNRITTYNTDQMDTTRIDVPKNLDRTLENFQNSSTSYKNRMTTFDENKMEISGIVPTLEDSKVYTTDFSMSRKPNMEMSQKNVPKVCEESAKSRATSYNIDQMDMSRAEITVNMREQNNASEVHEDPVKSRVTSYNIDQMDMSRAETTQNMPEHTSMANLRVSKQYEIHVSPKEMARAKRAERGDANKSNYLEVPKSRATTYNVNKMDISGSEAESSKSIPKVQIYNEDIQQNMSMEVKESPLHKKRATTHNRNNMDVSALMIDQKRTTSYLVNNMDVSVTAGSSGFCEQSPIVEQLEVESNERRKTFTVMNKRESMKWHNITDQDLLNMIDDESNPCIQDISASIPVSSEASNVSRYEEAMEDFMNLTVKASPLNQSVPFDVKMRQRRESRVLSPVRDYNNMFDNLIKDLKQKDRPKPRLEIDEYLEKLKIEPVKIPYYPQNQEGYLLNKIKELRQKHNDDAEKEQRIKKEIEATQFPQIPSAKFLMKNYIECMENEILKEVEKRRPVIAPVFPEAIDFEQLLNNKFRTDEHLSKYWNLDSLFLYKGSFKLTHKMMKMFTLNMKCQQYLTAADESTIPIIFKDVMLYLGPDYRRPWSKTLTNSLLRRQFHRAINGVDNFTSICSSSNHLFTFLDYYHENVMKANETVNNFFAIVNKYKAVYKVHHVYKHKMVRKRCFLSDDIVDIEICVEGYLEDISIKNLLIDGNDFTYTLEPHTNISETKGLMLVELILFDTEKFLQNNTSRIKIEED